MGVGKRISMEWVLGTTAMGIHITVGRVVVSCSKILLLDITVISRGLFLTIRIARHLNLLRSNHEVKSSVGNTVTVINLVAIRVERNSI